MSHLYFTWLSLLQYLVFGGVAYEAEGMQLESQIDKRKEAIFASPGLGVLQIA